MLPPVLVAARFPVVVSCPKSTAPPAVAATFPPAVVVPKSSAPPAAAVTLPPTVLVPNVRSPVPPAVATRFPVVLIGPKVSAPVSAIATEPLIGVPFVVAAFTGPTKSLVDPDRLMPPGPLRFSAVVPALEIPVPLA